MNHNVQGSHRPSIYRVLRQTADRVQLLVDASLAPTALTMPHLLFLEHLIRTDEGVSLGQMAQALGCGRSNITQLADRLERLGLIAREPDRIDRRSIQAVVTAEGRKRYPGGAAALSSVEQHLRRKMSAGGARRLVKSLDDLTDAMHNA